jgi:hypothetical protein
MWESIGTRKDWFLALSLVCRYNNVDEFVSDIFLDRIEMYPDGRAELDNELHLGFKTRLEEGVGN